PHRPDAAVWSHLRTELQVGRDRIGDAVTVDDRDAVAGAVRDEANREVRAHDAIRKRGPGQRVAVRRVASEWPHVRVEGEDAEPSNAPSQDKPAADLTRSAVVLHGH